jgi:hypothetical protein
VRIKSSRSLCCKVVLELSSSYISGIKAFERWPLKAQ